MPRSEDRLNGLNLEDVPSGVSVLAITVFRLSRKLKSAVTRIVAQDEAIGLVAWRILMGLSLVSDATQRELVEFTRTEQVQVSRILKDMEARGLIKSGTALEDRRAKVFSLTDLGRTKHQTLLPQVKQLTDAIDDALSTEERSQFLSMCERIAKPSQQAGKNRRNKADLPLGPHSQDHMEVTK
ncbi:MAG: winged helix-turn-helix transcriptional regulator [Hyphomicrobiales bacterium]|nr:winged helix-turn-helix transcriptional regulator [Hyphomicrobiales bacterium]MCP4999217.1 winged helix-turn-helix transcriptional regulator [Hyphomicrobiales bacterium]